MEGQPPWEAHLESILLEFLQDPPEPQEAGLSHAKDREAAPHLPEVGSPTALQGAQYVHLFGDITHQEIATLTERATWDQSGTEGFLLKQNYVLGSRLGNREAGMGVGPETPSHPQVACRFLETSYKRWPWGQPGLEETRYWNCGQS